MQELFLLVTKPQPGTLMQSAYMVGTRSECARYALKHGLRATTEIIPF